ncbi:MAG: hypothetical protein ACR2FS_01515 [Phormidesmis sp.]
MSAKRKKKRQFPQGSKPKPISEATVGKTVSTVSSTSTALAAVSVQPEHMSLAAHAHIVAYLEKFSKGMQQLEDSEMVSILQLSQHLRVFGLLSAVGFVKQANQQSGEVQKKRRQVWELLLCKLLNSNEVTDADALMKAVVEMTNNRPAEYLALWRRSIILSKHWNFWAKAYQKEKDQSRQDNHREVTP